MNNLILKKLEEENIIGVIPVNPIGLNIKFAKKSLKPNFLQILLMFLISLPITILVLAILAFILGNLVSSASIVSLILLIPVFLVILVMPTYLVYKIYINRIKKYPETIFVITKQNSHFFLLENNIIGLYHKFDVSFKKLNEIFYGEINKKTNVLGNHFEIRQNNKTLIKGKLKLVKNSFECNTIDDKFILPINELQKIYLQ